MATASTGWKCTHSASVISQTNTTATIRVTGYWTNDGWQYDINHVSAWVYCNGDKQLIKEAGRVEAQSSNYQSVSLGYHDYVINKTTAKQNISCKAKITSESSYVSGSKYSTEATVEIPAKPSYTITYNANGGSGTPSNQTKWYGTSLSLSGVIPSRTGHTFVGWATSADGNVVYQPGATYTNNSGVTLYAKWTANTYTITYNANGGAGAPDSQTKTYGVNLNLSSTIPTRTNYNFLGWATSANGGVVYRAGNAYTENNAITLYAVWELAYTQPRITNFSVHRCKSDGTAADNGTYLKVTFDWATDHDVEFIYIDWKDQTVKEWNAYKVEAAGRSGYVDEIVGGGNVSADISYHSRAYVEDSGGATHTLIVTIGTPKYPIDIKAKGKGVAIGKAAEVENLFDVGWSTDIAGVLTAGKNHVRQIAIGGENDYTWIDSRDDNGVFKNHIVLYDDRTYTPNMDAPNLLVDRGMVADLNDIKDSYGIYGYQNTTKNIPGNFAGWGSVINYKTCGWCYQIAFGNYLIDTEPQMLALRTFTNNAWTDWQYVGGRRKTLYDNASGTNGTVTLSESVNNFDYIDIYYAKGTDNTQYKCERVLNPNGKIVSLITGYWSSDTLVLQYLKTVIISDTSITVGGHGRLGVDGSGGSTITSATNYISIYKVVGYK